MKVVNLPEGKLFQIEIIYNNIENVVLLLHAIDKEQAKRYLYTKYQNVDKFDILEFKEILSLEDVSLRTEGIEDIRIEKSWDTNTTQVLEYKEFSGHEELTDLGIEIIALKLKGKTLEEIAEIVYHEKKTTNLRRNDIEKEVYKAERIGLLKILSKSYILKGKFYPSIVEITELGKSMF